MKTTRITIKGSSGYGPADMAFEDCVSLTPQSIKYTYKPYIESETNHLRKWSYKTDSPVFFELYNQVEELLPRYLDSDEGLICEDLGITEILVTYEDKSRRTESWCCPSDWFSELFDIIKKMVPACEDIPEVLATFDDKEDA